MEKIRRCATELREHGVDGFIVILPTAQKLKALETVFGESPVVVKGTSRRHATPRWRSTMRSAPGTQPSTSYPKAIGRSLASVGRWIGNAPI
jgi:hypothetical protein